MEAHCVSPIRYLATAGALLFIAGVVLLMGILTAETLYPGYSTSGNMISDLGATTPPQSFDATMILSGLLVFVAACLLSRESVDRLFTLLLALLGSGISGVGVFNGSYGTIHALLALFAFLSGGMMCIAAFRVVKAPFPVLSLILGIISLGTLGRFSLMGSSCLFTVLGMGGVE